MIRALLGARWLPYAAIGAVALLATASFWAYGRGYAAAERAGHEAMVAALEEQSRHLRAQTAMAVEKERRKHATHQRISSVRRIDCQLSPECVQWTEDILRAAHADH